MDIFSDHRVAGGAPLNVAFHSNNFGVNPQLISALGADELGDELKAFLKLNDISDDLIHTNFTFPTGTVKVTIDSENQASYKITEPVAWDFLYAGKKAKQAVSTANYLLFGSLACRSENNCSSLFQLTGKAQKCVFDVNLRPPYVRRPIIQRLLTEADIVKMNDEELVEITTWYGGEGDLRAQMHFISRVCSIETLVVTAGTDGAYCLHDGQLFQTDTYRVEVQDTVGCGDSFLAAFLFKTSQQAPWQDCLTFACATGALVATKKGGTPFITESDVITFMTKYK